MPRKTEAGMPRGSVLAPIPYSLQMSDASTVPGTDPAVPGRYIIYGTEKQECNFLCKLQHKTHCSKFVVCTLKPEDQ
jgi:hypothetical protein